MQTKARSEKKTHTQTGFNTFNIACVGKKKEINQHKAISPLFEQPKSPFAKGVLSDGPD